MAQVLCQLLIVWGRILYGMHAEGLYVISFVMQAHIALPVREFHQVMFAESRGEDRGERFGISDTEPEGEDGPNIAEDCSKDAPLPPQ